MEFPQLDDKQKVLLIWHQANTPETLEPVVTEMRGKVREVALEHAERLIAGQCIVERKFQVVADSH